MGKNHKKDKCKERPSASPGASKTTSSKTTSSTTTNALNLTQVKESHTIPKVTPQVPKGPVPSQKPGPVLPPTNPSAKPTSGQSGGSFQIPKGGWGDKRGREPSQSSKNSGRSMVPPPAKHPKTYAAAAKNQHRVQDQQWPALQLWVYKNTTYHEPISYDEFGEVREAMMNHSLCFLEENPDKGSYLQVSSTYYNKLIHCGVYNFANVKALNWFKQELPKACAQAYRGWTNNEHVTTFVKIFMPQGFEKLLAENYLKASRLMFRSVMAPDIPWGLINESVHPTKHTRQIIASIPTATLTVIQARGAETSEGSGVWKADGFLAPFKLTVASASDLRNANAANTSNQSLDQDQVETSADNETAMASPPPSSPARSTHSTRSTGSATSSTSSQSQPLGLELTPSKFPGLINDPLLSAATNVDVEANEENLGQVEEAMDFHLLDDEAGGAWADDDN